MEAAYISALAALAGTVIGGLTSFATSWTTLQAQARAQRLANERDKREALFGRFLEEAAKLYADALQNKRDDASALIGLYALIGRIRLISSVRVVESADTVARIISAVQITARCDKAQLLLEGQLGCGRPQASTTDQRLADALAINVARDVPPPFGLLQIAETLGLGPLHPEIISPTAMGMSTSGAIPSVPRARLALAMISTSGHWGLQKAPTRGPASLVAADC
jgi:hypothetical protein